MLPVMYRNRFRALLALLALLVVAGCAEGPLWKTGYLSPQVRQRWQDEEQIAATLFGKRRDMREMVDQAVAAGAAEQQQAARDLSEIVAGDPVALLRVEAVQLLNELPGEDAAAGLKLATQDREPSVRRAAVVALGKSGTEQAAGLLASMAGQDEDEDIRIAAVGALGNTRGPVALAALAEALKNSNPAMQMQAAESLARVTDEDFGADIVAWQDWVDTAVANRQDPAGSTTLR